MAFDREFVDGTLFAEVRRDPYEMFSHQFDLGDRKRDIYEWLEGNREVVAVWLGAPHRTLELAVHKVHDD